VATTPSTYVGVMSGTSLDGVDVAVVDLAGWPPALRHARTTPFPDALRGDLLTLTLPEGDRLDLLGQCDAQLGELIARAILEALDAAGMTRAEVAAIGSHGQTIRHRPDSKPPFTLQIGDPAAIAERTGITTVADFRRADVAAGGQGAPLVPAFHAALFAPSSASVSARPEAACQAIANIGGIANVTLLAGDEVTGFDTGPGNVLLDLWTRRHRGEPYDAYGAFAASGTLRFDLLERLLADAYFRRPPPKSTGRETFNAQWLETALSGLETAPAPEDVQATLLELTARTLADGARTAGGLDRLLVAGGGRCNEALMARLAELLAPAEVTTTDVLGVDGDWLEAMAFAWLARERLAGRPGNLPSATGARGARVLGGIYAAPP